MKYKEMLDNVLVVLYVLKNKHTKDFFSLNQIIKNLNYKGSQSDIYNIGKYLEADGSVRVFSTVGDMFLDLTAHGIVYVEENFDINHIAKLESVANTISKFDEKAVEDARQPIYEIIDKLKGKFKSKNKETNDAKTDIAIMKLELKKVEPSKGVFVLKIHDLEKFNHIHYELVELKSLLDVD